MLEIWHNPRCSKSRETLAIIKEAGAEVRVRLYINDVPSMAELERVLEALEAVSYTHLTLPTILLV